MLLETIAVLSEVESEAEDEGWVSTHGLVATLATLRAWASAVSFPSSATPTQLAAFAEAVAHWTPWMRQAMALDVAGYAHGLLESAASHADEEGSGDLMVSGAMALLGALLET